MPDETHAAENGLPIKALTDALYSTETTSGWYGQPECEVVARILAPTVRDLLAEAWDEGNRHESEYLDTWGQFDPNPVNPYRVIPPGLPHPNYGDWTPDP